MTFLIPQGPFLRRPLAFGVTISLFTADPSYAFELQRAPDLAGAPDVASAVTIASDIPGTEFQFVDPLPTDGVLRWYRCRSVGFGDTPSAWTNWVSALPGGVLPGDRPLHADVVVRGQRFGVPVVGATDASGNVDLGGTGWVRKNAENLARTAADATAVSTVIAKLANTGHAKADFAVGNAAASLNFGANRHNDEKIASDGDTVAFDFDFDHPPQIRAIPQAFVLPGASSTVNRKIEFAAIDITVSTFKARAVSSTGSSVTARTDDFHTAQNTTPGTAAGVTLALPGAVAYCQLSNATAPSALYRVFFDVNTLVMNAANTVYIDVYRNDAAASTTWSLVGAASYGSGVNSTGLSIDFVAAMGANWDVRLVISYAVTPATLERASIKADRVDYDAVTAGVETSLTPASTGSGILFQAQEAP